jgi:hypothetical protein
VVIGVKPGIDHAVLSMRSVIQFPDKIEFYARRAKAT